MTSTEFRNKSFLYILNQFLTGRFEPFSEIEKSTEIDLYIYAKNRLWDQVQVPTDLSPLFYSKFESCLYAVSKISYEDGYQELIDLIRCYKPTV